MLGVTDKSVEMRYTPVRAKTKGMIGSRMTDIKFLIHDFSGSDFDIPLSVIFINHAPKIIRKHPAR